MFLIEIHSACFTFYNSEHRRIDHQTSHCKKSIFNMFNLYTNAILNSCQSPVPFGSWCLQVMDLNVEKLHFHASFAVNTNVFVSVQRQEWILVLYTPAKINVLHHVWLLKDSRSVIISDTCRSSCTILRFPQNLVFLQLNCASEMWNLIFCIIIWYQNPLYTPVKFISFSTLCNFCFRFPIFNHCNVQINNNTLTPADCSVGVKGQSHLQAAQLFALAAQDALHAVVPVSQPVGQIHVGQVEVRLRQRVRALRETQRREDFIIMFSLEPFFKRNLSAKKNKL